MFYLGGGWLTPDSVQALLLAQCSGISSRVDNMWCQEIKLGSAAWKANTLTPILYFRSKYNLIYFYNLSFIIWGIIIRGAQGLFQVLFSGVLSLTANTPICSVKDSNQNQLHEVKCLNCCIFSPAAVSIFIYSLSHRTIKCLIPVTEFQRLKLTFLSYLELTTKSLHSMAYFKEVQWELMLHTALKI